ncbi:P-loop containing nucleoside triphosphate hydrolase protein [Massarina eburnea CBS 473.64]|uniref:P-loop containing nucleoside triphosphate hydrolase protein n=1 Tax=Massarina eburnea CBS 473.64 TaxID=1395130 RepID=A0A6A6SFU2_9PLEO|nr:P-loop containing nucleoside triphosphate hydrolase protein [Massarina eburnea CBS 473.64]
MSDTESGAEPPERHQMQSPFTSKENFVPTSTRERIWELEQQYISLLETKVAILELQVSAQSKEEAKTSKSDELTEDKSAKKDEEKPDAEKEGSQEDEPRYKIIISKYDPEQGDFQDIDMTKKEEKKKIGPENKPKQAFTLRKLTMTRVRISARRMTAEELSSEVEIHSIALQQLVGKVTHKYGWNDLVVNCRSPYIPLIHAWEDAFAESLKMVADDSEDDKQARIDLAALLNIISTSSGDLPLDRYFKDRRTFLQEHTITHAALCSLFPPGTMIVAYPFLDQPQMFSVQSSDGFVPEDETFEVICYSLDWNGYEFNRVPYVMKIPYWGPDHRSIVELPFFPIQYYVDANSEVGSEDKSVSKLENILLARGKRFAKICLAEKGKQMFKYKGDALFHSGFSLLRQVDNMDGERSQGNDDNSSTSTRQTDARKDVRSVTKKMIDGTAMIDFASFYEYLSPNTPILGTLPKYEGQLETLSPERRANDTFRQMYKFDWDRHPKDKELTREQYMLCPPRVLGYVLKQKKWAQLLVNKLEEPDEADASTFQDKLQLDDELKELVEKSVKAHEKGKNLTTRGEPMALQDFAPDKGKGLIIMLYGYPGVGKTLTAESVALMAGKPLLSVGVSDVGIEGEKVEANLQKVFDLAGKWEAVLLFDEADVFLEARGEGDNDIKRNAMVSVLLRVLEYYDGILILTTNRMKSFDVAVQSRIHIAIKYEDLSPEQQIAIFRSFLQQLQEKKLVHDYNDLDKWVRDYGRKFQFNGRQIRNVIGTAMGLAMMDEEHPDGKLRRVHLSRVAEQTKTFKLDLKSQEDMFKRATR